jgi:hypothetical protein
MLTIERIIWGTIIITLLLLVIISRNELMQMSTWVEEQNEQLHKLDSLIDDVLTDASSNSTNIISGNNSSITDFEINLLTKLGLENPVQDLKNDLMERSDLIQFEGVLGGTMRILSPDSIVLLQGGWVFAVFEDGHIAGSMLLEYSVQNGIIDWSVLQTKLF